MSQFTKTVTFIMETYLAESATDPDAAARKQRAYAALGSGREQQCQNAIYEMTADPFYRGMAEGFLASGGTSFADLEKFVDENSTKGADE